MHTYDVILKSVKLVSNMISRVGEISVHSNVYGSWQTATLGLSIRF